MRTPNKMPTWLERQFDNVEKTIAGWSKGKRIAAGLEQSDERVDALIDNLKQLADYDNQKQIASILTSYLAQNCSPIKNQNLVPLTFAYADIIEEAGLKEHYPNHTDIVYIKWRGNPSNNIGDFWTVMTRHEECISRTGELSYEMRPSERTDEWKSQNRYSLAEALELAAKYVDEEVKNTLSVFELNKPKKK